MSQVEQTQKGHPKGLFLLFATEMAERFSYYGMRAIFTLYMVKALLLDKSEASSIYGSYTGLVYLTPLLGGYIADKYWGNRKSIIFGGILMAIGQFFMFLSGSMYENAEMAKMIMYTGLGFLIFGNGFFKPNISTMVGSLYRKGDSRVDSAFTIFYMGINMGALIAPLVCGGLGEVKDEITGKIIPSAFKYGFLAACIGMILSLIVFIVLKNKYIVTPDGDQVGMPPHEDAVKLAEAKANGDVKAAPMSMSTILIAIVAFAGLFAAFMFGLEQDAIGSAIFSSCIVLPAVILMDTSLTKVEKTRIWVIYIIAFFVIFFWSAFEQAGASLTFFAEEQTDRVVGGFEVPSSWFQVFNAAFIVALAPVAVAIWSMLGKMGKEPASPVKQAFGLLFLALGYLYIAYGVKGVQPWDKVGMQWLVGLYLIHTIGELCLSPIGLSMVVKLAPARLVSLLMGVWFMSTAAANKFAGTLSEYYPEPFKVEAVAKPADQAMVNLLKTAAAVDTNVWKMSPKEMASLPVANFEVKEAADKSKSVTVSIDSVARKDVSVYALKYIRTSSETAENFAVNADGTKLIKMKDDKSMEIWNLNPEKPKFAGFEVSTLYDFFMIFVYMAGAASLILFLLSGRLVKMMNL